MYKRQDADPWPNIHDEGTICLGVGYERLPHVEAPNQFVKPENGVAIFDLLWEVGFDVFPYVIDVSLHGKLMDKQRIHLSEDAGINGCGLLRGDHKRKAIVAAFADVLDVYKRQRQAAGQCHRAGRG